MEMCYDGALVMPGSYVVMSEEEMTYVEGGKTLTKKQCLNGLAMIGINSPQLAIAGALTFTLAKCLIRKVACLGGIATAVVGAILTWAAGQIITLGRAIARGAINKGVSITWNWNIFKNPVGINYSVRY